VPKEIPYDSEEAFLELLVKRTTSEYLKALKLVLAMPERDEYIKSQLAMLRE
jgi:preprotein translocase subunit Sss1